MFLRQLDCVVLNLRRRKRDQLKPIVCRRIPPFRMEGEDGRLDLSIFAQNGDRPPKRFDILLQQNEEFVFQDPARVTSGQIALNPQIQHAYEKESQDHADRIPQQCRDRAAP